MEYSKNNMPNARSGYKEPSKKSIATLYGLMNKCGISLDENGMFVFGNFRYSIQKFIIAMPSTLDDIVLDNVIYSYEGESDKWHLLNNKEILELCNAIQSSLDDLEPS